MSQKVRDSRNRWRSKTVAFRMSPEEAVQLDMMAATSGMPKQDYLIKRVLCQDIIVLPNPRMQKELRVHLERITEELTRINIIESNSEILETINYLIKVVDNMSENKKSSYPAR